MSLTPASLLPDGHLCRGANRFSATGITAVCAAHIAVVALLGSTIASPLPPPAVMVHMVLPPTVAEIAPPPSPSVQRKVLPRPVAVPRPSRLAALAETPTAAVEPAAVPPAPPGPTPAAPAAPSVQAPRFDAAYLNNPSPDYPALSRRLGEEGKVVLRVLVGENGRPVQIELRTSSGSPRLDQAALAAVGRWQFIAARRGDEVVAAWVLVPLVFNLRG